MRTPAAHAGSSRGPPFAREVASGTHVLETKSRPSPIRDGQRRRCAMKWHLFVLRVTVKDGERAFLMRNGRLERVLEPGRHSLFDPRHELTAELHNVVRAEFPAERFAVLKAARPDLAAQLFEAVETKADEVAIVRLDGRPTHLMGPWQTRVFWKVATARRGRAHRRGGRPEGLAAASRDDRARAQHARRRARGREPGGRSALRRGPARRSGSRRAGTRSGPRAARSR